MKHKAELVYKLRELTDETLSRCKQALADSDWDFDKAFELVRKRSHGFYKDSCTCNQGK